MMGKKTRRLNGKHHSIPRCFSRLFCDLEHFSRIDRVGLGKFGPSNKWRYDTKVKYYDEPTKRLKITAYGRGFFQDLYVFVRDNCGDVTRDYIANYFSPKINSRLEAIA